MVVSGSADSNMRLIMKITSDLESKQGAVELPYWMLSTMIENVIFTMSMETWISNRTYISWRKSYCHLLTWHLGIICVPGWQRQVSQSFHIGQFHGNWSDRTHEIISSISGYVFYREPVVRSDTLRGCKCQPTTNLAELRPTVIDACQVLPLQTLTNLINSRPRQVQALYDARCGHTKY